MTAVALMSEKDGRPKLVNRFEPEKASMSIEFKSRQRIHIGPIRLH